MKRYVILFVAVLCVSTASAWNKFAQECIATLAEQNLTPEAKRQTESILGGSLASGAWWLQQRAGKPETKYTGSWHFISVTDDLRSLTQSEKDGVVQIERCTAVLRNRAEQNDSTVVATLKTLIHLVADMHNVSHVRIGGIPDSRKNFNLLVSNGKLGPKEATTPVSWRKFWDASLINRHASFSPELFALDLTLCYGEQKENVSKGSVREWAEDMGRLCAPLYEWAKPEAYMSREHNNRLELINDKTMARAGYRLAALLNDIFK